MNNLKTYTVTVTRIDNSKDTFKMTGTSRRNIFKQLNDRIRQGDARLETLLLLKLLNKLIGSFIN